MKTMRTCLVLAAFAGMSFVQVERGAEVRLGAPQAHAIFEGVGEWLGKQVSAVGNFASNTLNTVTKAVEGSVIGKAWNGVKDTVVGKGLQFVGGAVLDMGKELVGGAIQLGKGAVQLGTAAVKGVQGGVAYIKGDKKAASQYFSDSWKNLKEGAVNTVVGAWKVASNMPMPSAGALNVLGKLGKAGQMIATGWKGISAVSKVVTGLPGQLAGKGAAFLQRLPGVGKAIEFATSKAGSVIGKGTQFLQQRAGSLFGQGKFGTTVQNWIGKQGANLTNKAVNSIRNLPQTISSKVVQSGMAKLGLQMPPPKRGVASSAKAAPAKAAPAKSAPTKSAPAKSAASKRR